MNKVLKKEENLVYLKNYQPSTFHISKTDLHFIVDESHTEVISKLSLKKVNTSAKELFLDGIDLELKSIHIDGQEAKNYEIKQNGILIKNPPENFELTTKVFIYPQKNTSLSGLYKSKDGLFSQCEAQGFRKITYYLDRPDVLSIFTTKITIKNSKYSTLLSNGNLKNEENNINGELESLWVDPFPKPSYLFAIVVANLEYKKRIFTSKSGKKIELFIFAAKKDIEFTNHALDCLEASIRWDEDTFNLEMDLDRYMIVAVDDFNMGAMENKGLNIFNTKYVLANEKTATDKDLLYIDRVIAHEYFHNWTGNRVTLRDWFQLSLKEGLTVFRDQLYGEDRYDAGVQRIQEVKSLRMHQFAEDSSPMAHPVRPKLYKEINNFYTSTIYEKGAEIIRMICLLLGKDNFTKSIKYYLDKLDGKAATIEEFLNLISEYSEKNFSNFINWYNRAGTPVVNVDYLYNESKKTLSIKISQKNNLSKYEDSKPLLIPIKVGLLSKSGKNIEPSNIKPIDQDKSFIIEFNKLNDEILLEGIQEPVTPSMFQDFSAPVITKINYSNDDLVLLLKNDTNLFNKWDAFQKLAINELLKKVSSLETNSIFKKNDAFYAAIGYLINNFSNTGFLSECLTIPAELTVLEMVDLVKSSSIYKARKSIINDIAYEYKNILFKKYNELSKSNDNSSTPSNSYARAYKNLCLNYLNSLNEKDFFDLAKKQMLSAGNMTDEFGAFSIIVNSDFEEKNELINSFYNKWKDYNLVIDKWFAVQASSSKNTIEKMSELLKHQKFNIRNPNNVYSTLRTFGSNIAIFHKEDGSGYNFLAEKIIELDSINPQVASRVLRSFDNYKKFSIKNQSYAKEELNKILLTANLSRDCSEICNNLLESK